MNTTVLDASAEPRDPAPARLPQRAAPAELAKGDYSHFRVVPARYPARTAGTVFALLVIGIVLHSTLTNPRWGWGVFAEWFFAEPVLQGLGRTLLLTALGALFGFFFGTALALARVSGSRRRAASAGRGRALWRTARREACATWSMTGHRYIGCGSSRLAWPRHTAPASQSAG